jgi:cytoskeletal protein RodZ
MSRADRVLAPDVKDEMADAGAMLRAAREARGLSIDDITRSTKISGHALVALEEKDLDKLPAMIFSRGFLKAYAREVGLDPETTAEQYFGDLEPAGATVDVAHGSTIRAGEGAHARAAMVDERSARALVGQRPPQLRGIMTLAAAVGLVAYLWLAAGGGSPPDSTEVDGNREHAADAASGSETQDATHAAATVAHAPTRESLRLEFVPRGPCWLVVSVDGSQVLARLLQAGEREILEVREELVLRVGDPAALSFSINGRSGRPLGRAGEPVNVRITKENFREFLSS